MDSTTASTAVEASFLSAASATNGHSVHRGLDRTPRLTSGRQHRVLQRSKQGGRVGVPGTGLRGIPPDDRQATGTQAAKVVVRVEADSAQLEHYLCSTHNEVTGFSPISSNACAYGFE